MMSWATRKIRTLCDGHYSHCLLCRVVIPDDSNHDVRRSVMVDVREERNETTKVPKVRNGRCKTGANQSVWFNHELYDQVRAEAISRGWTFGRMVRHLCEASIEGIE